MAGNDTSSPEERDRLVAEALAHAEARDALYRPPSEIPSRSWKGLLATVLLVLSTVLLLAPPVWLQGEAPPTVSSEDRTRGARLSLELQAHEIEAFRLRHQRLPERLEEVPTVLPGIRFVRSNVRVYQLVAYDADGRPLVYDSTRPAEFASRPGGAGP